MIALRNIKEVEYCGRLQQGPIFDKGLQELYSSYPVSLDQFRASSRPNHPQVRTVVWQNVSDQAVYQCHSELPAAPQKSVTPKEPQFRTGQGAAASGAGAVLFTVETGRSSTHHQLPHKPAE